MNQLFEDEAALAAAAASAATGWREAGLKQLTVGLQGDLGVGKTTFVRALLRGLGFAGRVPSPTYTLLEHYEVGSLTVVHLDLYRLEEPRELEFLGIRDWLTRPEIWILAEWPEKGGRFSDVLDLELVLTSQTDDRRRLAPAALTASGRAALEAWLGPDFN